MPDDSLMRETELEGYYTGNGEVGRLAPMEYPDIEDYDSREDYRQARELFSEMREDGAVLGLHNLIPDGARDGKHKFKVTVVAESIEED